MASTPHLTLSEQVRIALRDPSYLFLHAGFFTCGFHVAFLVTHLPSDLQLYGLTPAVAANSLGLIGLFNVAGSARGRGRKPPDPRGASRRAGRRRLTGSGPHFTDRG